MLVQIGFTMLNGRRSTAHHGTEREREVMHDSDADNIAFYPMTFPMLVGPGTITTLILYAQQVQQPSDWGIYAGCVVLVLLMIAAVFYFAGNIGRYLSNTARTIMTRLLGMVLISLALGMVPAGATVPSTVLA